MKSLLTVEEPSTIAFISLTLLSEPFAVIIPPTGMASAPIRISTWDIVGLTAFESEKQTKLWINRSRSYIVVQETIKTILNALYEAYPTTRKPKIHVSSTSQTVPELDIPLVRDEMFAIISDEEKTLKLGDTKVRAFLIEHSAIGRIFTTVEIV